MRSTEIFPFVKWAGGKRQILPILAKFIPNDIKVYAEPFVGGGALFFHILNNLNTYEALQKIYISDVNPHLINVYRILSESPEKMLEYAKEIEAKYNNSSAWERHEMYYSVRERFNSGKAAKEEMAALFLFLNRTCFNGLWRVNNKTGHFNVPFNKYGIIEKKKIIDGVEAKGRNSTDWEASETKTVKIFNIENLQNISSVLQRITIDIECADYKLVSKWLERQKGNKKFCYFDPPYREVSKTSKNFKSYTKEDFGDREQIELSELYKELISKHGVYCLLSNAYCEDDFFNNLYETNESIIKTVSVNRNINSDAKNRKGSTEILVIDKRLL